MRNLILAILTLGCVPIYSQPTIQWQKCYGGSSGEEIDCLVNTKDKGLIFAGYSSSSNGQVSGQHGLTDMWVVKLDSLGNLKWQKPWAAANSSTHIRLLKTMKVILSLQDMPLQMTATLVKISDLMIYG